MNSKHLSFEQVRTECAAAKVAQWIANETGKPLHKSGKEFRIGDNNGVSITQTPNGALVNSFDSSGLSGDVFDVIAQQRNVDKAEALQIAAKEIANIQIDDTQPKKPKKRQADTIEDRKPIFSRFIRYYRKRLIDGLHSQVFEKMMEKRGLEASKIETLQGVGFAAEPVGWINGTDPNVCGLYICESSLVFWNETDCTILAIRLDPETGKRKHKIEKAIDTKTKKPIELNPATQLGNCHWQPLKLSKPNVYLCEGETSAIALMFSGIQGEIPAQAVPLKPEKCGENIILELAKSGKQIFLAYDNDNIGKGYTKKALALVPSAIDISGLWRGEDWGDGTDPNDFVKKFGEKSGELITAYIAQLKEKSGQTEDQGKGQTEDQTTRARHNENQDAAAIRAAIKAMTPYQKEKTLKDGTKIKEFEHGSISPLVAYFRARGVYRDTFATDSGLRLADGTPITNTSLTHEQMNIEEYSAYPALGGAALKMLKQAAETACDEQSRDGLKFMIDTLPDWDGVQRIDRFFAAYCGAKYDDYTRAVSRNMWTGIIGRAMAVDSPCKVDTAIILRGEQGIGKSELVKAICLKNEWCVTISQSMGEDELKRVFRQSQMIEIGELGILKPYQLDALKRLLSSDTVKIRKKGVDEFFYFNIRAGIIATTDGDEILNDAAGSCRWLPIEVKGVKIGANGSPIMDTDGIKRDRLQLYAEAKHIYFERIKQGLDGVAWDEIPKELRLKAADRITVKSDNADKVLTWFMNNNIDEATLETICACVFDMDAATFARDKKFQTNLGNELKLNGFVKDRHTGNDLGKRKIAMFWRLKERATDEDHNPFVDE